MCDRFEKVVAGHATTCHWPLTRSGARRSNVRQGYIGAAIYESGIRRDTTQHRKTYEAKFGRLSPDMTLDHLCRNRWCCNAEHLEPVNRAENLRRGDVAKLSKTDVKEIRAKASEKSQLELAHEYGVSQSTISRTIRGEQWADGHCPAWGRVKSRRANARVVR